MKIRLEKLRSLLQGAVSFSQDEKGIHPCRFTEEEMEYYGSASFFHTRALASAGIRLECRTDAREIRLACHLEEGSSRRWCYFDVCADCVLIQHSGVDNYQVQGDYILNVKLDGAVHLVAVYFPNLTAVTIQDLDFIGASFAEPVKKQGRFLAFGDSITQGYDAFYPSCSYVNHLADLFNMEVVNKAIGGEVHPPALLKTQDPVLPDRIFVAYGTNDWSKLDFVSLRCGMEEFHRRLAELYPETPVTVLLPLWRADYRRQTLCGSFGNMLQALRQICRSYPRVQMVEGTSVLPHDTGLFRDGYLHPNDFGFQIITQNLYPLLCRQGWK